jgi:hypothetical protein
LFVPTTPPPLVRVVSIAGHELPPSPTGSFEAPDVQIAASLPVDVTIEAFQVPVGTRVDLFSENGSGPPVLFPPLEGDLSHSTTTMQVVFPVGFTRGFARAVWR